MPSLEFNDLGKIGLVKDTPAYMLPPEAFSTLLNMRVVDDGLQKIGGWTSALGAPSVAPHFLMPISTSAQAFWLYAGLTKIYAIDGVSHVNITRQSAGVDVNYTVANGNNWNGTIIAGVPVLNNGTDLPQFWGSPSTGTKMANLTNWNSNHRAKFIRAFGPYLVAGNITKSGANYAHMIKWSDAVSNPGTVPGSWDESDTTTDAGEYELPDVNSGVLLDALPLQSKLFLYKEGSIWAMRYIGGRFIFSFENFLETVGLLAPRCVTITGDGLRHVVATQDDIIVHNGNSATSILDTRMRRTLFNELDTTNYLNSFMFTHPQYNEVWFCYVPSGETAPTKALVWNYKKNFLFEVDGITFTNAALGTVETATEELWSDGTDTWAQDTGPWAELLRRKLIVVSPANTKFYSLDTGLTRDGLAFSATAGREGLSIIGKKRDGSPIVDHQILKFVRDVWPKIQGGPVSIRIGFQDVVDGAVRWSDSFTFNPTTMVKAPAVGMGRAVAVEFSTTASVNWRLDGWKMDFEIGGNY
jgi:hypothetical protein